MKIIEALKQIKDLQRKADDLKVKVATYSAYLTTQTPVYPDQKRQVSEWIQAHGDILKEILRLRFLIQKTNILTNVPIELGGKTVTKTIAEWIHRRRDLAISERTMWQKLTDRNLQEGATRDEKGEILVIKIVRCYDPVERDNKVALYDSEPSIIDGKLEIINATTDIIE